MIDSDRIFALLVNDKADGEIQTEEGTHVPLMDFLTHDVPEVEEVTRIDNTRIVLTHKDKSIQKRGVYGDSSFFKVHIPTSLSGNVNHVLSNSQSVAISQKLALELFGTENVLGKTIVVDHKDEFLVSGVFAPYPENSDFNYFDFVLPFTARPKIADEWVNYDIKLFSASAREATEKKIDRKMAEVNPENGTTSLLFGLNDWRLHWNFKNGKSTGGRIVYVVVFSIASLFVLIMSCVNYMNIATARATKRTREIGVRKMTGATQSVLIRQFMTESLIMTCAAIVLSLLLAQLLLPAFNQLVGVQLSFSFLDPTIIIGSIGLGLLTGLLAGSYPALVLSSFKPAVVLKANLYSNVSGAGFRNGLVVFQFTLSVVMIFCALVMWRQTDFLLKKDLGYDKHRIINVWLERDRKTVPSFDNLRSMVLSHSAVESAAFSGASPMEINGYSECNRVTAPLAAPLQFYGVNIDDHTLSTLKFELVAGRNFSHTLASDSNNFIITQSAARLLGFDQPLGQRISYTMFSKQEGEIVGVVKDFQNDDIHIAEKPVVFVFGKPRYLGNLFVRYQEGRLDDVISHLKSTFEKIQPGIPVSYSFLDADFETQLHREKLLKAISFAFTVIAVTIACLGLFGLVLFNTQRRTKEIGIRKVLGASEKQIVLMICQTIVPFVFYSLLLAFPIAFYFMRNFLEGYPSRITISADLFLGVTGIIIGMVLLTVSYQSIKAARQKTVDSLKIE
ncbi:ABC transporter permease [Cytophagales bacterium WSM2-2]|nr:ABC transporter permease [Cytophagales bacterium WSM2-2]